MDQARDYDFPKPESERPQRVAVVGSGPAGLACAFELRQRGYQVTVFEKASLPGGMLTLGIPAFRLPREVVAADLRRFHVLRRLLAQFGISPLKGELPTKGSVLAPDVALCESCPRRESKPEKLAIGELKRPHQLLVDSEKCLLAQGLVCMGPATRSGCGAACVSGNMPCTGCLGPTSRVWDQGAKALSGLASLLDAQTGDEVDRILGGLPDPAGTFYRYSVAASLLMGSRKEVHHDPHGHY